MSLGARLSILAGLCFAAFCAAFAYVSVQASDTYFQDVTQELSAPMAMYVARDRSPFHDTAVDAGQFRELAATAMILNPAIELYALDAEGRIVAAAADIHSLARSHVDLAPVRQFISQSGKRPILGDDPREGNARRIFTAVLRISPPDTSMRFSTVVHGNACQSVPGQPIYKRSPERASAWYCSPASS
jgi:hypothetical protein